LLTANLEQLQMSVEKSISQGIVRPLIGFLLRTILVFGLCQQAIGQSNDSEPRFPRIASIQVGNGISLANQERLNIIGKADVVLLGFWVGWAMDGNSMADVVDILRAKNPDIILAPYTNVTETRDTKPILADKVWNEIGAGGTEGWWLRKSDGTRTSHWKSNFTINHSNFVTPDANGQRYPEFFAGYNYDGILSRARFNAVFLDVMTGQAIEVADWNGDGVDDAQDSDIAIQAVSEGHLAYAEQLSLLQPGIIRIGNVGNSFHPSRTLPAVYNQLLEGGLLEGFMGRSWSIEGWGGWQQMMTQYRSLLGALRGPKIAILNAHVGETDYQLMRYGLTSALMDNGYFAADPAVDGEEYSWQHWYDEFDQDLGFAIDPPQTAAWSNGVYRREFDNGLVLVNPRGNGQRTVNVGSGWKRFSGVQDALHNSGQVAETISLSDADGIILLRVDGSTEPETTPLPPTFQ
jgi:hypothetical protein